MDFTRTLKGSLPGTTAPFPRDAAEARGMTVPVPAGRMPGTTYPTPGPAIGSSVTPCGCTGTPRQKPVAACGCTAPSAPIGARGVLAPPAATSESARVPPSRNGMTVPVYTPLAGAVRPVAAPPGFAGTVVPRSPRVKTKRPSWALPSTPDNLKHAQLARAPALGGNTQPVAPSWFAATTGTSAGSTRVGLGPRSSSPWSPPARPSSPSAATAPAAPATNLTDLRTPNTVDGPLAAPLAPCGHRRKSNTSHSQALDPARTGVAPDTGVEERRYGDGSPLAAASLPPGVGSPEMSGTPIGLPVDSATAGVSRPPVNTFRGGGRVPPNYRVPRPVPIPPGTLPAPLPIRRSILANPNDSMSANELSITTIQSSRSKVPILFASYNSAGTNRTGWTRSVDGGATWTSKVDATTRLPKIELSAPGLPGLAHEITAGDTFAAAVAPDVVAMTCVIVHSVIQGTDVGLWISKDGGETFPPEGATRVSETDSRAVDGPKVASIPGESAVWVWWYAQPGNGKRPTNWIRKFTIVDGVPRPEGPPLEITAPGPKGPGLRWTFHASITVAPRVTPAFKPRIHLTYTAGGAGLSGRGAPDTLDCSLGGNQTTYPVTWFMAYSDDDGLSWKEEQIAEDRVWPNCITSTYEGANRSFASTAFDEVSGRLLITLNHSAYRQDGRYVGTRAMLFQWPSTSGRGFDVWVPVCNPEACPGDEPCLVDGRLPDNETSCHQYNPSVGVVTGLNASGEASSRAVWLWYDTRDSRTPNPAAGAMRPQALESDIWGASIVPGYLYVPRTMRRVAPLSPTSIPWSTTGAWGNTWVGEYSSGVTPLDGALYGMWVDMRDVATVGAGFQRLYGAVVL